MSRAAKRRLASKIRVAAGAVLAGLTLVAMAGSVGGAAQPSVAVISLNAAGAWGSYQEMPHWKDDLFNAAAGTSIEFAPHGSLLGREALLNGTADFAFSGVPFTQTELAHAGGQQFIDAPIQVSALSFIVDPPQNGLVQLDQICDPNNPPPEFVNNPDGCLIRTPYNGPIRFPAANLSAAMFRYPAGGAPPLRSWSNPAILRAWGFAACSQTPLPPSGCALTQLPGAGPGVVGRSDGDETSYYLQQYAKIASPAVWNLLGQFFSPVKIDPITERMPILSGNTRDGVDQQQLQLLQGGADPVTGTFDFATTAGAIGYLPPSAMYALGQLNDASGLKFMEVQNANGDWVSPTPASINAAVDAGGATPLYALTHKVKDAYPLVWVEHLYAPAHGLSISKTEALAAVIRYIATAGQDITATVGEGRLPPGLVSQSLEAANDLVRSNCVGEGRETFTSTDPGPYAPKLPALSAIGPMLHCGVGASTTTSTSGPVTTTTTATTPPPTFSPGVTSFTGGSTGVGTPSSEPASTSTTIEPKHGTTTTVRHIPAALSVAGLPLPGPPSSSGADNLATFLLGAGLFLFGRRPVARLAKVVTR
jgi:ABC-type phosphate transport system substrate-binding protein